MFTGIVSATGRLRRAEARDGVLALTIECPHIARDLSVGDSVAVDGVCLTAVTARRKRFAVEAVDETLTRTTLGRLAKGDLVNLELAARPNDRLGGHLVQGHVDATVSVVDILEEGGSRRLRVRAPAEVMPYLVAKGSIALNGVSLTVASVGDDDFEVVVIPHTLSVTSLGGAQAGDELNCEVDVIAKYVERLGAAWQPTGSREDVTTTEKGST